MNKTTAFNSSIITQLLANPQQFDFFQAVRLMELAANQEAQSMHEMAASPAVIANAGLFEPVRFQAAASLAFPSNAISQVLLPKKERSSSTYFPMTLQTTFHGLFGPAGLLPQHYTEYILQRLQVKDNTLKEFLDLFNHRLLTLFYRSGTKYKFYINYEQAACKKEASKDTFTQSLQCLIGHGTAHLAKYTQVPSETFLYFAGYFSQQRRSALILKNILSAYFAVPVAIKQFQGKWLSISDENCSRLAEKTTAKNNFNQLGSSAVLGKRVWDCQYHFRVQLGPLNYPEFENFLPLKEKLTALVSLVRCYIGVGLNFDVQLILKARAVPPCQLSKTKQIALGWNTWLQSKPCPHNVQDTILSN